MPVVDIPYSAVLKPGSLAGVDFHILVLAPSFAGFAAVAGAQLLQTHGVSVGAEVGHLVAERRTGSTVDWWVAKVHVQLEHASLDFALLWIIIPAVPEYTHQASRHRYSGCILQRFVADFDSIVELEAAARSTGFGSGEWQTDIPCSLWLISIVRYEA